MRERQRRRERLYWSSQGQSEERGRGGRQTDRQTDRDRPRDAEKERDRGGRVDSLFMMVTANQVCIFTSSPRPKFGLN